MFSLDLACDGEEKDFLIADLWERQSLGIIELDGNKLRAFFDDDAQADALAQEYNRFHPEVQPADNRDWIEFAHTHLHPMLVGERLHLVPQWRDDPTPEGRVRIEINAGLAFGTGHHETTRLCLEMLEARLRSGMTVLDVGTGSGILAEAARKLGAGRAVACDTDPSAVAVAVENLAKAHVSVGFFIGSADAVQSEFADLILANISPQWIVDLAAEWPRLLRAGGSAIMSGFEDADLERVRPALEHAGMSIVEVRGEATWRAIAASCLQ